MVVDTEDANTKYACFKATYSSADYYAVSGQIGGIDRTDPVIGTISLVDTDGGVNIDDVAADTALITAPTITETNPDTTLYKVISDSTDCSTLAAASFVGGGTVPTTGDLSGENDGTYKICVQATDEAGNTAVAASPSFIKDTTLPTFDTQPALTSVVSDGYLNITEAQTSADLITAPTASDAGGTVTLAYVALSEGESCPSDAQTAFAANPTAIPQADDLTGFTDGGFYVCVRATDGVNNHAYTQSPTFIKDTTAPTLPDRRQAFHLLRRRQRRTG